MSLIQAMLMAGGPAAWTPAKLFESSEVGAWYDPSDLSTLWKDTAGTVPVTTDGDLVARIDDKSGNGYHLTQSASSDRPRYKTDGTLRWLQFDGSNDDMTSSLRSAGSGSRSISAGYKPLRVTNTNAIAGWTSGATASTWYVMQFRDTAATGDPYFAGYGDDLGDSATPTIAAKVATIANDGTAFTLYRNGTSIASGTKTISVVNVDFQVGDSSATEDAYMALYGLVVRNAALASDDRASLESYLAAKSGVSL